MEEPVIEDEDPYAYTTDSNVPEIRLHEWEQWLVINIPGRNVSAGLQLYEYLTPHPAFKANSNVIESLCRRSLQHRTNLALIFPSYLQLAIVTRSLYSNNRTESSII